MLERGNVEHNSHDIYYRSTVGAAEAGSEVRLGIQVRTEDAVEKVLLRLWRGETGEKLVTLRTEAQPADRECYYFADIQMPEKGCLLWYYFIIVSAGETFYYGNNQEQLGGMGDLYDHVPPSYQITVFNKGAKTPDWFKNSVIYQIFPDRFCREGSGIVPKTGAVYHACWEDEPFYCKDVDTKELVFYDFFGGNLKGIEKKLSYLKDLGISVIYLNPVFESESNHHYDTGDYHKIDPVLGTNEDFRHLADAAKEMGIRIILDGVFSHTGSNSRYFNRKGMYDSVGAYQSENSPYHEWYDFRKFPTEYDCWWNNGNMPNVRETTPSYMDFIIHKKDSVLHYWMDRGASGWRMDVIDELPPIFSQSFYKEVKERDPEAVVIGEVWDDASNKVAYDVAREYLCGQEMDSAMNYPFRQHVVDFLMGRTDAGLCCRRMESLRENYPRENFYAMMNLIGSHDVHRAITLFGEAVCYDGMPAVEQARSRLDEEHYELGRKRLFLAVLWQMTYPGVPSVYYGDEVGMEGFKDPYNRRPYPWKDGDEDIRRWYKKCIAERNRHAALRTGELLPLYAEGDVAAYARVIREGRDVFGKEAENDAYIVAFNRNMAEKRQVSFDVSDFSDGVFESVLQEGEKIPVSRGRIHLELGPLQGCLLRRVKTARKYPRMAGVLLHPTSLPSKYGIGDFGKAAYQFVDLLAEAGQSVWQILPMGPVDFFGYSPYQSPSAFAGNPMLIDMEGLVREGWITEKDTEIDEPSDSSLVDFEKAWSFKKECILKAYEVFRKTAEKNEDYLEFCSHEAYWLEDYALFEACKREFKGEAWPKWPEEVRRRDKAALGDLRERLRDDIALEMFMQYLFDRQWKRLHEYAKSKGIKILGDMPIFISHDSADAWANQGLFDLNEDGSAKTVAGVPPDYFSATGQLWGNPQYDWDAMKREDYAWWKRRFKKLYEQVDIVRIDHFRGFESYWEISGKAKTAIHGHWRKGPGEAFFRAIKEELGDLPIVAEDLGIITDAVEELRAACDFPGMKVLHFTLYFNEQGRIGIVPPENSIVYTGTHDNNTTVGWYEKEVDERSKAAIAHLLHADPKNPGDVCEKLIEFAYASDARMAIIPMQDILHMDSRSRMNVPGTVGLNWKWCLKTEYTRDFDAARLKELCKKTGRLSD
ncbi:MAG: 4-alpha-glucanotransferase [Selenomonadaceae bacterium]|nr:4-alpha-glucanotransferase [Selenomonadaceae bacterium]